MNGRCPDIELHTSTSGRDTGARRRAVDAASHRRALREIHGATLIGRTPCGLKDAARGFTRSFSGRSAEFRCRTPEAFTFTLP